MEYERYFNWLSAMALGDQAASNSDLLLKLWQTPYIFTYDLDIDRANDGINLRSQYVWTTGDSEVPPTDISCSCLEVILALAMRCDSISGNPEIAAFGVWFDKLLNNLINPDEDISVSLDRWMHRQYAPDGRGGLFPLKNPVHDQRLVPTWNQLCAYLSEDHDI